MDNLKPVAKYAQFRYTPHDDEIRAAYAHILNLFPDQFTDTEYREEIALLMAQINSLLKQHSDNEFDSDDGIIVDRWRMILDTIKLKAALIREQRNHHFRNEKAKLDKLKLDVIPKDEFVIAINDIVNLVKDYVSPEYLPSFVDQMQDVLRRTTRRQDNVTVELKIVEVGGDE